MVNCDKCWKDEEETVPATHVCKQCKVNFCENHLGVHNTSNKTKSHIGDVTKLADAVRNCDNSSAPSKSTSTSTSGKTGGFVPFSGNYDYVCQLGEFEESNFELQGATAIALDPVNRSLFVADHNIFLEFDLNTKKLKKHLKEPQGRMNEKLCYDTKDKALVYVINRVCDSTVVKTSRDGKTVFWENDETHNIISMAVDRVDGTVYVYQRDGIDFLSPVNGKIIKSLRHNLQGDNIFGMNESIYSIALNHNNDFVLLYPRDIIVANKMGKILKKYKRTTNEVQRRPLIEPNTNKIFCQYDGIDSMNEDGTSLSCFMNEGGTFPFLSYCPAADIALDSATGELYCLRTGRPNVLLVFK